MNVGFVEERNVS